MQIKNYIYRTRTDKDRIINLDAAKFAERLWDPQKKEELVLKLIQENVKTKFIRHMFRFNRPCMNQTQPT